MIDECLSFYDYWEKARKEKCSEDIYCSMLDENRRVHETVLRYYKPAAMGRAVVQRKRLSQITVVLEKI